jgi:hypothetical protein
MPLRASRLIAAILIPFVSTAAGLAQDRSIIYEGPLSDHRVTYDIAADLDTETRSISGVERITWRNPDRVPVNELEFHLYLNAFAGRETTFMRESGGVHRDNKAGDADPWGGTEITSLRVVDDAEMPHGDFSRLPIPSAGDTGVQLKDAIEFIRPDDGNENDFTAMRVQLPEPVQPGETIVLNVEFESKLPEIVARTGWKEKKDGSMFFFVGQWFPKLAVYEVPGQRYLPADAAKGQWNTHQFHANSEFYADFGSYRVSMNVPEDYVVGATGILVSENVAGGRKTVIHEAEEVHDFSWTTSPTLLEFQESWNHVNIKLILQPEHGGQVERHFDAAKVALQYFDDWYGEYPYTTLTVVDAVGGANGMEYPTLITVGTQYGLPGWIRYPELVLIHEFGHQYFYGMLASNEFEEAWLDEGINSYTELKIMETAYGDGSVLDIPGWRVGNADMQRLVYAKTFPTRGSIFMKSWEYDSNGSYGRNSYMKPAIVLLTLENHVGLETMQRIIRTYYDRWRFRHPTTRDFVDVANEVVGEDLSWFFDQYIYGSVAVDYKVAAIRNRRVSHDSADVKVYDSRVVLQRVQEGFFPVDVVVTFDDGRVEDLKWDGRAEWRDFSFKGSAKVTEAFIDPADKVSLDINRSNNRRVIDPETGVATEYGLRFVVWVQQLLQLFGGLI